MGGVVRIGVHDALGSVTVEPKRISRRELLRTIGIAGAVAWAAPVVIELPASASIDRCTKRRARRLCRHFPLGDCSSQLFRCGTCSSDVGDGSFCLVERATRRNICAGDVFCSEAGRCLVDADCKVQGLGNVCITANGCTGCGYEYGICSRRCCSGLAEPRGRVKPRRMGQTASGR